MNALVETIRPYIAHYGYWAVFTGVFLESLGLPLPGETLIIVAGLVAAKGMLNFSWIIVIAVISTFLANNLSYLIGYQGGRRLLLKYGQYVFIHEKQLAFLEEFIKRNGIKVVVIARFILGLRQFNGLIAGTAKMPFGKFAISNFIGAVLWVVCWTGIAYYFGKNFNDTFMRYYGVMGIITLVVMFVSLSRFIKNSRKNLLNPIQEPVQVNL